MSAVFADTTVLFRFDADSFAVTGWGLFVVIFVALLLGSKS